MKKSRDPGVRHGRREQRMQTSSLLSGGYFYLICLMHRKLSRISPPE
jgi:hypothetical protein